MRLFESRLATAIRHAFLRHPVVEMSVEGFESALTCEITCRDAGRGVPESAYRLILTANGRNQEYPMGAEDLVVEFRSSGNFSYGLQPPRTVLIPVHAKILRFEVQEKFFDRAHFVGRGGRPSHHYVAVHAVYMDADGREKKSSAIGGPVRASDRARYDWDMYLDEAVFRA